MHGFYPLKQGKDVSVCCRRATNRYTKYDATCTITALATKTRRSICTRPTATKVFDKHSRAAFAQHTSYNWRNGEATYLVLLTRHCLFDIQRNLFHCKTHFDWYEIRAYFLFFGIHTITGFTGKSSFKLKISVNFLNFQNSTYGLKFGYISYQMSFKKMHDWFKVNESMCIAKFEQRYVITIIRIFENEPKSRRLDEKTFYYFIITF